MTQPVGLIFIIKVIALIKSSPFVRSVCLHDVLTFYNEENNRACKFTKDNFTNVFIDNKKRCQVNCSIDSLNPSYNDMDEDTWYEIERLQISFSSTTYTFILDKPCGKFRSEDFFITVHCEGKYIQDRGIGESCISDNQCVNVNANSSCDETTRLCQCKTGHLYLWEYKTCSPERRLNETCDDDIQCSMVTTNSICNKTTRVCTCNEGHLEMMNMCVQGRSVMEEISYHCKRVKLSIENLADKTNEQICSIFLHEETFLNTSTSEEAENKSIAGLVIGAGIAGLVIGIAMCGAVYVIMIRHKTNSQKRTNTATEEINQPRSVEVSNAVYSKPIQHKDMRVDSSIVVENTVYNHLHEDHSEISMQPDYDHVPQLGTEDDDYSHLATCNSTDVDSPGEYGVVN